MNVELIVKRFGTQMKLAQALKVSQGSVAAWLKAGKIPSKYHESVMKAGAGLPDPVVWADLEASDPVAVPGVGDPRSIPQETFTPPLPVGVGGNGACAVAGTEVNGESHTPTAGSVGEDARAEVCAQVGSTLVVSPPKTYILKPRFESVEPEKESKVAVKLPANPKLLEKLKAPRSEHRDYSDAYISTTPRP